MVTWKDLWSIYREKLKITPRVKDDFYTIMSEAVKTGVNADSQVRGALLTFLKPYAFSEYKSASGYELAAKIVPAFIQWLSEEKNKTITIKDLIPPKLTADDAFFFAEIYSKSVHVQALVKSVIIKFGKYLAQRGIVKIYPFGGLKVETTKTRRTIVYNEEMLDDFYNVLLFGTETYYNLVFRLNLETGLRPLHSYYLMCGDIQYDKPQTDALDRTFYPIFIRNVLVREKIKRKETISTKMAPEVVYISESLKNDIVKWCDEKNLTGTGYVFAGFIGLESYEAIVRARRKRPGVVSRLKHPGTRYIWYGLRDTWASVIYAITKDPGDLIDLGGWGTANIPLTVYRVSMKSCEALAIAKKWEIYLPPDKRDEVLDLQGRCERGEEERVPGEPTIGKGEMENVMSLIAKLTKQLEDERGKREALEKLVRR